MARNQWEDMLRSILTGALQGSQAGQVSGNEMKRALMLEKIKQSMEQEQLMSNLKAYQQYMGGGNVGTVGTLQPVFKGGKFGFESSDPLTEQKKALEIRKLQQETKDAELTNNLTSLPFNTPEEDKQKWLKQLQPRDAALVKGITDYRYDIMKGLSFKDRERIGGLAAMYDPSFDMKEFNARYNYKNEFGKGKIGGNIRSYNTVLGHLGSLYDAVQNPALPSSSVEAFEGAKRAVSKGLFGKSPSALAMASEDASLNAVAGELATVFKGTSGTDQEIDKWLHSYNKNAPKEAKQMWIKQGIDLVQSRMGAIGYDFERVMGKPYDRDLVSPKAGEVLNKILIKGRTYRKGESRRIGNDIYIRNETGQWIKS